MNRQNIALIVMLSLGVVLFTLGIIFMTVCNFSLAGLIIMCVGLTAFVPICPIYQKLGGYDIVFQDKLKTFLYIIGIFLIAALGVGVTFICNPLNLAIKDLQLGGILLTAFAAALLLMNACIYETIKKKD